MKLLVVPAILAGSCNVLKDISNENQRYDLKLVRDRLRRRGRERRNQGQHFIEQDETEWSSDRRQIVLAYGGDDKWRMRELSGEKRKMGAKALQENNEQMRVLTLTEQERYLAVATPMLWDVAMTMVETGMRPEEVYRIRPENVSLRGEYLFNPYGKTKAAKRRIKLTATVASILARRIREAKGAYLFPHDDDPDQRVPKVNNAHDRAVKASKVAKFRLYDLRHTWATRAVEAGINLVTLAALMGHSRIQMVLRYAHPTQEHQTKAMEKLERHIAEQRLLLAVERGEVSPMIQ